MTLTKDDLNAITGIIDQKLEEKLEPIKQDLRQIKSDVKFLAALNQLEEIKKDPRLRRLYESA